MLASTAAAASTAAKAAIACIALSATPRGDVHALPNLGVTAWVQSGSALSRSSVGIDRYGMGSRGIGGGGGGGAVRMVASSSTKARRNENVAGNLFVDESCIDCDTCRWMQGDTFVSARGKSAVARQPETEEERRGAYRAMFACPTNSIRLEAADPLAKEAIADFPFPVDTERLPGVFHMGFHAENSYGCSPWLVERDQGNVMMDSPRLHKALVKALAEKGGVSLMVMSHIDDVGDHQRWKESFPDMTRVMHKADVRSYGDTLNVELQLDSDSADGQIGGLDYWDLAEDLRVLHTPGHSRGSITLLYNPSASSSSDKYPKPDGEAVAFTGDHLAYSGRTGALTGFPRYGENLVQQSESMKVLARPDVKFRWEGLGETDTSKGVVRVGEGGLQCFLAGQR